MCAALGANGVVRKDAAAEEGDETLDYQRYPSPVVRLLLDL